MVMSPSIAAMMLQLLGQPTLLYQPKVHTNLEVTMLYAQQMQQSTLVTSQLGQ